MPASRTYLILLGAVAALTLTWCKTKQPVVDTDEFSITNATYEEHVQPILRSYCTGCHSGKEAAANLDLSVYDNVKAQVENKVLLDRIHDEMSPMPPEGLLPENMQKTFQIWADQGYKRTQQ